MPKYSYFCWLLETKSTKFCFLHCKSNSRTSYKLLPTNILRLLFLISWAPKNSLFWAPLPPDSYSSFCDMHHSCLWLSVTTTSRNFQTMQSLPAALWKAPFRDCLFQSEQRLPFPSRRSVWLPTTLLFFSPSTFVIWEFSTKIQMATNYTVVTPQPGRKERDLRDHLTQRFSDSSAVTLMGAQRRRGSRRTGRPVLTPNLSITILLVTCFPSYAKYNFIFKNNSLLKILNGDPLIYFQTCQVL